MSLSDSSPAQRRGRSSVRRSGTDRTGTRLGRGMRVPTSDASAEEYSAAVRSTEDPGEVSFPSQEGVAPSADEASGGESLSSPEEREYQQAKEIVLRQLGMMARSRAELAEKLTAKEISEETAQRVLDRFEELKLIDDAAYAEAFVRSRATSRTLARPALRRELARKGVTGEDAEAALAQRSDEDEREDAAALVRKKIRPERDLADPSTREKALRRLTAMLARRGYSPHTSFEVAQQVLEESASR